MSEYEHEHAPNRVIVCSEAKLTEAVEPAFRYPEAGRLPDEQVEVAKTIVMRWAHDNEPFVVATTSPYVLKAIEVAMDEHECGADVVYVGPDGKEVESTQELFQIMYVPFSKLMHGEHYEREAAPEDGHGDK